MAYSAEAEVRDLKAVVALCKELARADVLEGSALQLRDAVPRLELTTSNCVVIDVRVDANGTDFLWKPSFGRHPIADVPGAAQALISFMRDCGHQSGGGSDG